MKQNAQVYRTAAAVDKVHSCVSSQDNSACYTMQTRRYFFVTQTFTFDTK